MLYNHPSFVNVLKITLSKAFTVLMYYLFSANMFPLGKHWLESLVLAHEVLGRSVDRSTSLSSPVCLS